MSDHSRYISPFSTRYASPEMQFVFSEDNKFRTWRRLWIALARAEQKQGLPITDEQIAELEAHKDDINYDDAQRRERECRHDVMSHVYAYGLQCPKARGIIHLGATSCYVGDNTDVILMKQGLEIVRRKVLNVMDLLARFAEKYKALPALAYTHLQPAQLTTVGKRATLWLNELYMDFEEIEHRIGTLALLGSKGTTGTQASFMELLGGDSGKIRQIEQDIAKRDGLYPRGARQRADLQPQDGLYGGQYPFGHRADGQQVQLRHAPSAKLQGDGGALRGQPDRFLRHALQAQSHALRAHYLAQPLCDGGHAQHRHHRRHPVVRAHAGRQRQHAASP